MNHWRFDGEFFYSINGGSLSDYRVDGDEIYTRNPNEIQKHIGTFENGKAIFSQENYCFNVLNKSYWLSPLIEKYCIKIK
jgi:hypothetical protein